LKFLGFLLSGMVILPRFSPRFILVSEIFQFFNSSKSGNKTVHGLNGFVGRNCNINFK